MAVLPKNQRDFQQTPVEESAGNIHVRGGPITTLTGANDNPPEAVANNATAGEIFPLCLKCWSENLKDILHAASYLEGEYLYVYGQLKLFSPIS